MPGRDEDFLLLSFVPYHDNENETQKKNYEIKYNQSNQPQLNQMAGINSQTHEMSEDTAAQQKTQQLVLEGESSQTDNQQPNQTADNVLQTRETSELSKVTAIQEKSLETEMNQTTNQQLADNISHQPHEATELSTSSSKSTAIPSQQKILEFEQLYRERGLLDDNKGEWKSKVLRCAIALLKKSPNKELEFTPKRLIASYKAGLNIKRVTDMTARINRMYANLGLLCNENVLEHVARGRYRLMKLDSDDKDSDESEDERCEGQTGSESKPLPSADSAGDTKKPGSTSKKKNHKDGACAYPAKFKSKPESSSKKKNNHSTNKFREKKHIRSAETALEKVLRYEAKYKDFYMRTTSHWKPPVLKYIFILLKEQPNLDLEFTRGELHKKYHLKIEIEADSKVSARGNSLSSCLKGMCYDGVIEHVGKEKSGRYRIVAVEDDQDNVENENVKKPPAAAAAASSSSSAAAPSCLSELSEEERLSQIRILMERHENLQREAEEAKAQAMILLQRSNQRQQSKEKH